MKKTSLLPFAVALALSGVMSPEAHASQDATQLIARAEQGDVSAMLQLGQAYLDGQGVNKDIPRGIELLESVIARNGPQAAFAHTSLATHYERNLRTPDDKARMFRHYRLAAGLGDTAAQTHLAKLLLESIQANNLDAAQADALRGQAVNLLTHAYENGRTDAAMELGRAYMYGRGLERNVAEGFAWLTKAADARNRYAAYLLGYQYLGLPKGAGYDAEKGRKYMELAADLGHREAMVAMVEAHLTGKHWTADLPAARRFAQEAVALQLPGAQSLLSRADAAIKAESDARLAAQQRAEREAKERAAEQARLAAAERAAQEAERVAAQQKRQEQDRIAEAARQAAEDLKRKQEAQLAAQSRPAAKPSPMPSASRQFINSAVGAAAALTAAAPVAPAVNAAVPTPGQYIGQAGITAERRIAELSSENTRLTQEVSYLRTELAERDERIATLETTVDRSNDLMAKLEERLAQFDAGGGPQATQRRVAAESKPQAWNRAGLELFRAGEYQRALREFDRAAKAGNVEAMNNLGMAYLQGRGAPRNAELAMGYFRQAAERGHATAANNIGYIYENGMGVVRDSARAQLWYRRAAHLNTVLASAESPTAFDDGYRIVAH